MTRATDIAFVRKTLGSLFGLRVLFINRVAYGTLFSKDTPADLFVSLWLQRVSRSPLLFKAHVSRVENGRGGLSLRLLFRLIKPDVRISRILC